MMGKRRKQRVPIKTGRVVHHFWLNVRYELENTLNNQVQELKKQRKFAETIRDGLRLVLDLRAGSLVVLFELFPWIAEKFAAGQGESVSQNTPPPDTSALDEKIAHLEELVLILSKTTYEMKAPAVAPKPLGQVGLRSLAQTQEVTLPRFEDDDEDLPTIVTTESSGKNIGVMNFLSNFSTL